MNEEMQNYPEYPDSMDAALKNDGLECGETDFERCREIYLLVTDLYKFSIQSQKFVRRCLKDFDLL